ncbi:hypothetical protein BBJK_00018 [Bifidobacterium bifidum LMG 13195]|uniref:Uncharacterized protein n=1 Tax=Bifidobacterium bifidum LMG 13195 TaxID=1207542 RepID=A0A286T9R3_BIFBI|nr:hypothetical protein BBJK_00018 [Bifidobacterium bifidum LMG 13195]
MPGKHVIEPSDTRPNRSINRVFSLSDRRRRPTPREQFGGPLSAACRRPDI